MKIYSSRTDVGVAKHIVECPRYEEYLQYLDEHIGHVNQSFNEIVLPMLTEHMGDFGLDFADILYLRNSIKKHDASKYGPEEFPAYCDKWYPEGDHRFDEDYFKTAWCHHQHTNPHHWQHWILRSDNGDAESIDMPFEYVVEMLCDWSSFRYRNPESTANNWYHENKDRMELSPNTAETVEAVLALCPEL